MYASPVNFDPHSPLFPISDPPEYAGEIARRIGLYYTTGMVEDHAGLNNERISEQAYLDQCEIVWREREAMMLDELEAFKEGFFYCLFDTPDRIQHLFWRFTEPDHPANLGASPLPPNSPRSSTTVIAGVTPSSARPSSSATKRPCSSRSPIMDSTVFVAAFI